MEYDVEQPEKYFENTFLVGNKKFTISFDFPSLIKSIIIYEFSLET